MKKTFLVLSVAAAIFILSGCMLNPGSDVSQTLQKPVLGYKPLPSDFLRWWFKSVPVFDPSNSASQTARVQLIAPESGIALTQQTLTSPVVSDLPSDYNSDLSTFSNGGTVPNIGDQWDNNTCWAFATVESLESAMVTQLGSQKIQTDYPFISDPSSPTLSTQFSAYNNIDWSLTNYYDLSYQETNEDNGGNLFFSFYNLIRHGEPLASDFPYLPYYENSNGVKSGYTYIQWNPSNGSWPQHLVKPVSTLVINPWQFSDYQTFIATVKGAIIKYGALAVSFSVYSDLDTFSLNEPAGSSGWVYPGPSSSAYPVGGHAVLLVGWDDNWTYNGVDYGPVWILENSWGNQWGDKGFWRQPMIPKSQFDSLSSGYVPPWYIENNSMYVPKF